VIRPVRRRLYHAPGIARGADAPAFGGEGDRVVAIASIAARGQSHAQRCRIRGVCERLGEHRAWGAVAGALGPAWWCEWGLPCSWAVPVCMVQRLLERGIRHIAVHPYSLHLRGCGARCSARSRLRRCWLERANHDPPVPEFADTESRLSHLRRHLDRQRDDLHLALGRYNGLREQLQYPNAVFATQKMAVQRLNLPPAVMIDRSAKSRPVWSFLS
jgi:hypothetical protein